MTDSATISLNDVSVYQNKSLVLANVTTEIRQGEFVYLIGRTGSGKSSLLKILYGEIPLKHGEGSVAGFDLRKLKQSQIPYLRRKLGIVFQDFQLLTDRSVSDNLKFVLKATGWKEKKARDNRIAEVLDKVGLTTKGFKKPFELSGGEQQRVVIARALLNDPDLILADEPTGNLDPETSAETMQVLFDISKSGRSVLMATHDHALMNAFPSRTIKCENGRIIDSGI